MVKRAFLFLILMMLVHPVNAGGPFYYGLLVDGVPYVFVDDSSTVERLKARLFEGMLRFNPDDKVQYHIATSSDSSMVLFRHLIEHSPTLIDYKLWKLYGNTNSRSGIEGFRLDQKLYMQVPDSSSSQQAHEIVIDGFFYDSNGALVLRCKPLNDVNIPTFNIHKKTMANLIISRGRYAYAPRTRPFKQPVLPKPVKTLLETMPEKEITVEARESGFFVGVRLSSRAVFINRGSQSDTLFALMCSYNNDSNSREGTLLIVDKHGNELYRSFKKKHYHLGGIVDADGDGTHELILRNGSQYTEAYFELLELKYDRRTKTLKVISHFNTWLPHFQPISC